MSKKYDPYGEEDDLRPEDTNKFSRPSESKRDDKSYSNFDTERFYATDEGYKEEKKNSYSHYSDYDKGLNKEERQEEKDPADDFFSKDQQYYSDHLTSKDVEKIAEKKAKENKTPFWKFLMASIFGAILALVLVYLFSPKLFGRAQVGDSGTVQGPAFSISPQAEENVETLVFEKAKDSVVGITTIVPTELDFFNLGGYLEGIGSGVIVSDNGYILTNSHVVSNGKAENINVILANQESYEGELVWYEPEMDLAVVKIEAEGLSPVELGDSDKIKVGEKAIAIGNPLGLDLQSTLTSGYISGLDRSLTMENGVNMDGLIQTDAAINSGNSGGALLNSQGKLIGINTAKASADNIGFAIPVNVAMVIIERIEKSPNFEPVTLGISAVNLDYYKNFTDQEFEVDKGVIVMDIQPNSPAAAAGIRQGDIITKLNGKEITSMGKLRTQLLAFEPGDTTKLEIIRDNIAEEVEVTFSSDQI